MFVASAQPPRGRVELLDALRGLLAVWVMAHHWVVFTGFDLAALPFSLIAEYGGAAVDAFFILSGYAIAVSLRLRPQPPAAFLVARFWRIYPVYIFALILGLGTWYLHQPLEAMPWLAGQTEHLGHWPLNHAQPLLLHVFLHAFQLHGLVPDHLLPDAAFSLVGPAWSLSTEFQFYLTVPILAATMGLWNGQRAMAVVAMAASLTVLASLVNNPAVPAPLLFRYLPLFFLGMIGAMAEQGSARMRLVGALAAAMAIGAAAIQFLPGTLAAILLWIGALATARHALTARILATMPGRALLWLGAVSYPLYLVHQPIQRLTMVGVVKALSPGQAGFVAIWTALSVVLSLLVAAVLHRKVERPAQRHGKLMAQRVAEQQAS